MSPDRKRYDPPAKPMDGAVLYRGLGPLRDPAILIQPYQDLFLDCGEKDGMRRKLGLLRGVDPEGFYVLVPLALGCPGGLSPDQAARLIDHLADPFRTGLVTEFHERLCLDDDVRDWIDARLKGDYFP